MKILIVIAYFIPEVGSAAHVYYDLAKAFIAGGHEVSVITSYPRSYNLSKEDASKNFPTEEVLDGIKVYRVKNEVKRDNIVSRGLEHFTLSRKFIKVFKRTNMDFDVCLIYIPPLPLYRFALKIKKIAGIPSVLNFQDFHPQELTDVGVLKNPIVIRLLKKMEKEAYVKADQIVVLTEGGIDYVVSRGANPSKVAHIYNCAPKIELDKIKADFKEKEHIQNRFLITYAGILSPFQGLDNILDIAKLLDDPEILFYIVGDGMVRAHLESRINDERISNVKILPWQDRDNYLNIIKSSDVAIVSLDNRMKAPCFPGKTRDIMLLGVPILGLIPDSETARIINKIGSGIIVDPNDKDGAISAILRLKSDQKYLHSLGNNGKSFSLTELQSDNVSNNFLLIFKELIFTD